MYIYVTSAHIKAQKAHLYSLVRTVGIGCLNSAEFVFYVYTVQTCNKTAQAEGHNQIVAVEQVQNKDHTLCMHTVKMTRL